MATARRYDLGVGEPGSADLRVGNTERDEALRVLGEHLTVGRLDPDEYGLRAAQVTTARTRGDLTRLFADLPQPHPCLDPPVPVPVLREPAAGSWTVARRDSSMPAAQRFAKALVPLAGIVALALFFGAGLPWLVFLLLPAAGIVSGAILGEDRRRDRHR
jgi:hypothetical protein